MPHYSVRRSVLVNLDLEVRVCFQQSLLHCPQEPSADSLIPSNQSTTFIQTFISCHLDPVKVDVKVLVENHKLIKVELLRHECGLGHPADVIVDKMVEQNTWDVDAVSGATISSGIIKNAVNKALR